jgi:hypothetical protein
VVVYYALGLSRTGPAEVPPVSPPDREPPLFVPSASDGVRTAEQEVEKLTR